MRIIDRYVLRQFVQAFFICYLSLTGLFVVFDAFANLDEFMRFAEKSGRGLLWVLADFYFFRAIFFLDRISGIIALIASMFTITWLRRHNELTALLAAGVSGRRVIRPVIMAAVAVALLASVSREVVIPSIRSQLSRDAKDLMGNVAKTFQPQWDNVSDIVILGKSTLAAESQIVEPTFVLPDILAATTKKLEARSGFYKRADNDHPNGYLLDGLDPTCNLDQVPTIDLDGSPVVLTPAGHATWLKPGQCFVVSNVSFEQITGGKSFRQFSSTWNLIRGLYNPSLDFGADVRVAVHCRIVQPILDMTLFCLGLPLVLTRENRNLFASIGICVALVATFLLVTFGCQFLGNAYWIRPALAAWFPMMIFLPCAVALDQTVEI